MVPREQGRPGGWGHANRAVIAAPVLPSEVARCSVTVDGLIL